MRILIYGSGNAREHSTFKRLKREVAANRIIFALTGLNVLLEMEEGVFHVQSPNEAACLAKEYSVDLVLILSVGELLAGITAKFKDLGCPVLDLNQSILDLEGRKSYSKEMMTYWGIPTPQQWSFSDPDSAKSFLKSQWQELGGQVVIKSDAMLDNPSHRVSIPISLASGLDTIELLGKNYFHDILIERLVKGRELSLHVVFDGETYLILPPVQDYKSLQAGNFGPNTAGMGAVASTLPDDLRVIQELEEKIVIPTLRGIRSMDKDVQLILYIGIIFCDNGPQVLEYNIRSGNPEWQALLPLIESPLTDLFFLLANRTLANAKVVFKSNYCSMVTAIVANGYPDQAKLGPVPISINTQSLKNSEIVGETIYRLGDNLIEENGRIAMVVCSGTSWVEVRTNSLDILSLIDYRGKYFRDDIGIEGLLL